MKCKTTKAIELMRQAAKLLEQGKNEGFGVLIIPRADKNCKYPLNIKPGAYSITEAAESVQFIADMLE